MTKEQLSSSMDKLLDELSKSDNKKLDKLIIAKAVQLGMQYQEELIKEGINIVFNSLHDKYKNISK